MDATPAEFEAIGNRLGFRVVEDSPERLGLAWQGPRFPALLCLGIALLLLFVSIPITHAIYLNGVGSRVASLWYFPLMNLLLMGIAIYLLAQRRRIVADSKTRMVIVNKSHFYKKASLTIPFTDVATIKLGLDRVYSGFAVAGSTATQSFPVPSLRLFLNRGGSVLLDRGSARRLAELGDKIANRLNRSLERDPALR